MPQKTMIGNNRKPNQPANLVNRLMKKRTPLVPKIGFAMVYEEFLAQVVPARKIEDWISWIFFPIILVLSVKLGFASKYEGLSVATTVVANILTFIVFSFLVISAGWVVGILSMSLMLPPALPWLMARLLIAVKSPYEERYGLSIRELQHLKVTAEIDQSASGWKNGVLTIAILTILLAIIQGLSKDVGQFINTDLLVGPPTRALSTENFLPVLGWIGMISIDSLLALAIFRPLGEFLSEEPINRRILYACNEAIALLEAKGFSEKQRLSFEEKNKVAKLCSCEIAIDIKQNRNRMFWIDSFQDDGQKAWLLRPPAIGLLRRFSLLHLRRNFKEWSVQRTEHNKKKRRG